MQAAWPFSLLCHSQPAACAAPGLMNDREPSCAQVLRDHESSISIKGLSDMTAIKTDDIISTLQHLQLIQYQKGQHVIYGAPASLER